MKEVDKERDMKPVKASAPQGKRYSDGWGGTSETTGPGSDELLRMKGRSSSR